MKQYLMTYLQAQNIEVFDLGSPQKNPDDDYPNAAARVANAVLADAKARGILICGSGQGVCIAANRFKGIRAALCWDNYEAKASRNDDDTNILCLPARVLSNEKAKAVLHTWLNTPFAGAPRFKRRITQMDNLA